MGSPKNAFLGLNLCMHTGTPHVQIFGAESPYAYDESFLYPSLLEGVACQRAALPQIGPIFLHACVELIVALTDAHCVVRQPIILQQHLGGGR